MPGHERGLSDLQVTLDRSSHALREPLVAISGFAQVLSHRHAGEAAVAGPAERILEAVNVMERAVDETLAYMALDGRVLIHENLDCPALIRRELDLAQPAIERVGAAVEVGWLPTFEADHDAMATVFRTLIALAAGDEPREGARVEVRSKRDGAGWLFGVGSDRPLVDAESPRDPFERFGRSSAPGVWSSDLAICRRLVEMHGGQIWLENEHGTGSISFEIPDRGGLAKAPRTPWRG